MMGISHRSKLYFTSGSHAGQGWLTQMIQGGLHRRLSVQYSTHNPCLNQDDLDEGNL